ncbi:FIST signal transduction protein [Pedobacter sp. SYSU D00535]|uniref:FIST signal transduction protein n=1 Tax=Pedobacter sp. SYSU D00535 TaxID=2810308 RepID=UPI001A95FE9C|nr:FIST N-terminal domain-containing protein [Pedobacter sp. SYSU D00535]
MTQSAVVFTELNDGTEAGRELGQKIKNKFPDVVPDVVIVFASSIYDYPAFLGELKNGCNPKILVGSSSAGEFTSNDFGTDSACAIAIQSTDLKFRAGFATGIKEDRALVAEELNKNLTDIHDYQYQYYSAMIFADALSGYTDELIDILTEKTTGKYQFFGGGAGDNANFQRTHIFYDTDAYTNSAVILEILSNKPIGVGAAHGWKPVGEKMRVTESDGMKLVSLNARPALEVFLEHAKTTGQQLDVEQPIPFFLHNIIGIEIAGDHKLRVPLAVLPDGSIAMASDVPNGAYVSFMTTDNSCSQEAAMLAAKNAIEQLGDHKPNVALFFDCVATRLRMGKTFDFELNQVKETLKGVNYAGCNTYGQVARVNGQFSGFQNCTAVVCVIPE